jgi:hypothetical protein
VRQWEMCSDVKGRLWGGKEWPSGGAGEVG